MLTEQSVVAAQELLIVAGHQSNTGPGDARCHVCIFTVEPGRAISKNTPFALIDLCLTHSRQEMSTADAMVGCYGIKQFLERFGYLFPENCRVAYEVGSIFQRRPPLLALLALHRIDALLYQKRMDVRDKSHPDRTYRDQFRLLSHRLSAYLFDVTKGPVEVLASL